MQPAGSHQRQSEERSRVQKTCVFAAHNAHGEIIPVRALLPVTVYGFSLFWAWNFLTFYSPVLLPSATTDADAKALARLCMLLGIAAGSFLSSKWPRIYALDMTLPALAIAFGLTLPINILGFWGSFLQIPLAARLIGWFLSGSGFALMLAIWSSLFVISWRHDVGIYVAMAVALGAVHCIFVSHLIEPYAVAAALLLPAFSLAIYCYVRAHTHVLSFEAEGMKMGDILPLGSSIIIALYGVLFGVPVYILLSESSPVGITLLGAALMAGALAYLCWSRLTGRYIPFSTVLRLLLPISVLCFFLLPFVSLQSQYAVGLVLVVILSCLDTANLSTIIARSYQHAFPPSQLVAAGRIYLALGKAIGWSACYAFLPDRLVFPHATAIVWLGFVLLLAIAVALVPLTVFVVNDDNESDEIASMGRFAQRLSRASALYGLSDREQEVLRYLAKGRHAQYIGTALHISPHTAKTHIYHIYRKMSVNSLEELMDVVEHTKI